MNTRSGISVPESFQKGEYETSTEEGGGKSVTD